MKRVFQDLTQSKGNCFQACLASLFELPIDEVPHFMVHGHLWFDCLQEWLEPMGYYALDIQYSPFMAEWIKGYWIATGVAKRGILHSVIYLDEHLVHDPHPSCVGIESVQSATVFCKIFRDGIDTNRVSER